MSGREQLDVGLVVVHPDNSDQELNGCAKDPVEVSGLQRGRSRCANREPKFASARLAASLVNTFHPRRMHGAAETVRELTVDRVHRELPEHHGWTALQVRFRGRQLECQVRLISEP